jgi:hypothetical protein
MGNKMLMFDDEREISHFNNDQAQQTIAVGKEGVTKIEVYKEHGNGDFIPHIAVWKGDFLFMRTSALDKEIIYN